MQPLPALLPAPRPRLVAALLMFSWCAAVASPVDGEELRVIDGRYVRIVTDLPPGEATDQLAAAFDAAVPRWCAYWDVALSEVDSWRVTAYVMANREGFVRRRLLPKNLPEFPHGYQAGERVWLMAQPSDYYTRHLLLHEGVHAIAERLFGAAGPPWFAEGTAELLATHRWDGSQLELPVVPESREAFPYWGRFKLLDERRETGEALSLEAIFRYRGTARRQVEPYAWSWAATAMLDAYPDSRAAVRQAARRGRDRSPAFTDQLRDDLSVPWQVMRARWRILIDEFDYGYDLQRNRVELDPAPPAWDGRPLQVEIAADRGWQAAPIRLPAGASVRIEAEGRYEIGTDPRPWVCEPQGVTVRYHRGRPLGMLLATAVAIDEPPGITVDPLNIAAVGRGGTVEASHDSWLLLRVGDDPAALEGNRGTVQVRIFPADPPGVRSELDGEGFERVRGKIFDKNPIKEGD